MDRCLKALLCASVSTAPACCVHLRLTAMLARLRTEWSLEPQVFGISLATKINFESLLQVAPIIVCRDIVCTEEASQFPPVNDGATAEDDDKIGVGLLQHPRSDLGPERSATQPNDWSS